ncbi:hypothetical protein [Marivita sp. GX14005]|uniref:hypothetical protein n=1 Tax=Marivita sp. GX14005 TaxID=2942276 RepID=UPI00201993B2|nr:hypothetical protein [Marivita sp. GX14005]MCL3881810.1 hypothetical protein [Marivita sp. GX14005]
MTSLWRLCAGMALTILVGCGAGADLRPDAPLEVISSASYRHDGPPALTLYTMINNRSEAGAHTSLMINASQRIIFDPAGSVRLSSVPERDDVLYGVTPEVADFYARAHARKTYRVAIQRIEVPADVAERAMQLAIGNGPVGSARCAQSTAALLRQLPGFESIGATWFPKSLMRDFGALPGVETRVLVENDDDDKTVAIAAYENKVAAR